MAENPKVSVLMTTWNRAGLISRSIESVRAQTFGDWELIVVDDGSTDNTQQVLHAWLKTDARIRYIQRSHVGRISVVSNAGLKAAKGEYVAVLDDDDWWTDSRKLEKQIEFLDSHPDYVGCGGGFLVVDKDGGKESQILKPETDQQIRKVALLANPMGNSTTMFRCAAAREAGNYDETMKQYADWDFWLKMGNLGKLYNFPEHFLSYRMWNRGSSFVYQRDNAESALKIIRRHKNDYPRFYFGLILSLAYWLYARLPAFIRIGLNSLLSRTKKRTFSLRRRSAPCGGRLTGGQ